MKGMTLQHYLPRGSKAVNNIFERSPEKAAYCSKYLILSQIADNQSQFSVRKNLMPSISAFCMYNLEI